jgi:CRISPR-associated protein Cas8a1/Csx13
MDRLTASLSFGIPRDTRDSDPIGGKGVTSAATAPKSSTRPDQLTMRLFAPGMSVLHRAGLGGLACTLKAMERQYRSRILRSELLPGPYQGDRPPWSIDAQTVTLRFGKPENAGGYLRKLFAFAFRVRKDGLISLPGQYKNELSAAVLADLQAGLTLTFLQHGRVRALAKEVTTVSYDPENEGVPGVVVEYKKCSGFKHQKGWETLVDKSGALVTTPIKVDGPISPGSVVRHVAFTGDTGIEDPPERILPLYFALVGCLALPVNRGVAALLVPDVTDLTEFVDDRPAMTPTTATECQIAGAADAGFRAQVRIRRSPRRSAEVESRARQALAGSEIPACYAMTFTPTPWASQQKSRVATIIVPPGERRTLDLYERAAAHLPARIVTRTVRESTGRGRRRAVLERQESFRADSIVRPLVAENLALGRRWYAGFAKLMTKINPATGSPYRNQVPFERGGLNAMLSDPHMWDDEGESLVVKAVHEAIRQTLGRIKQETDGSGNKPPSQATKNRWTKFQEGLRLSLAGAKTANDARHALCDLFSRAGHVPALMGGWQLVLPKLADRRWQLTRDLALLALASYSGKGADVDDQQPEQ